MELRRSVPAPNRPSLHVWKLERVTPLPEADLPADPQADRLPEANWMPNLLANLLPNLLANRPANRPAQHRQERGLSPCRRVPNDSHPDAPSR